MSIGALVGGLVNVAVIVLQWRGMEGLLQMVGLSSAHANYHQYVAYTVRIPGLHGHHNASSAVVTTTARSRRIAGYFEMTLAAGAFDASAFSTSSSKRYTPRFRS